MKRQSIVIQLGYISMVIVLCLSFDKSEISLSDIIYHVSIVILSPVIFLFIIKSLRNLYKSKYNAKKDHDTVIASLRVMIVGFYVMLFFSLIYWFGGLLEVMQTTTGYSKNIIMFLTPLIPLNLIVGLKKEIKEYKRSSIE